MRDTSGALGGAAGTVSGELTVSMPPGQHGSPVTRFLGVWSVCEPPESWHDVCCQSHVSACTELSVGLGVGAHHEALP